MEDVKFVAKFRKEHDIQYGNPYGLPNEHWILSVDGKDIHSDKHLYVCKKCGWMVQSKALGIRTVFEVGTVEPTPEQQSCKEELSDFIRVCECEEVI